jgi:hypothetical protein
MVMNNYIIKDNFLPKNYYTSLKNFLYSTELPWYHKEEQVIGSNEKSNGFFTFCWYNNWKEQHHSFETAIRPMLEELECIAPIQVRSNLLLKTKEGESAWHVDFPFPTTTALIYFTTCNGGTVLKINGEEVIVDAVENRLLEFDGRIEHKGIWQTDVKKRIIINLNYIKK